MPKQLAYLYENTIPIYFDSGIDNFGGWLKVMKAQKLVSAGGAWYTYTDDDGVVTTYNNSAV